MGNLHRAVKHSIVRVFQHENVDVLFNTEWTCETRAATTY